MTTLNLKNAPDRTTDTVSLRDRWDAIENVTAVDLYFGMRADLDAGTPNRKLNKRARYEAAARAVNGSRNAGAFERKCQNISAILAHAGAADLILPGLKPLEHAQMLGDFGLLALVDAAVRAYRNRKSA